MSHELAEQRFGSYEDVKKSRNEWLAAKVRGIQKLPEICEKCITSVRAYIE